MTHGLSTSDTSVLYLQDVAVSAAGRLLLTGIDLDLAGSERVAVSGPSGSGKTTLLRTITGLIDPAHGQITLAGRCPDDMKWPCYRRRTILVEQRPILLNGTVHHNLALPFQYHTATTEFDEGEAASLLTRLLLPPDVLDQEARSLSQGEQQRTCLARALLLKPQVLLMDEPTSALDEDAARAVEDLIREETDNHGMAALIITHSRQQAENWCHRILDLRPHMVTRAGDFMGINTPNELQPGAGS